MASYTERLIKREKEVGRPVRVAGVGAGQMGRGLIATIERSRGLEVSVVADIAPERGVNAYANAGRTAPAVVENDLAKAAELIEAGAPVVITDGLQVPKLPVDIVLEGLDVAALAGGLVADTISKEIQRQVRNQVAPIITDAVAQVLTPERLADLRAAAVAAAEAELAAPDEPEPETPELYYGSVDEFVREFLIGTFRRKIDQYGLRWPARWWESTEAIIRLEALWRSWEHLRLDPATGMSIWLRDHADYHLGILMSRDGIWSESTDAADIDQPLPYEAPPEGLFPDVRDSTARRASAP